MLKQRKEIGAYNIATRKRTTHGIAPVRPVAKAETIFVRLAEQTRQMDSADDKKVKEKANKITASC